MDTQVAIVEIRVITGPKLNHCFIWYRTMGGEDTLGVDGWHYMATTRPSLEFLTESLIKREPMLWPQMAPPNPNEAAYRELE